VTMVTGIIGKKVGMTQLFAPDGTVQPVTVIKAGPCVVVQAKTVEKDGYHPCSWASSRTSPRRSRSGSGHLQEGGRAAHAVRREVKLVKDGDALKAATRCWWLGVQGRDRST